MSRKPVCRAESPSLGAFMTEVSARLAAITENELKELLLAHARATEPAGRTAFLEMITLRPTAAGEAHGAAGTAHDACLLEDVDELTQRIEGGEFFEGYEWDPEIRAHRAYGDESWAEEMDDLFARADALFVAGEREIAGEAYARLLRVLASDDASEMFSGQEAPESMVKTSIGEAVARALRATLDVSPPAEAARRFVGHAAALARLAAPRNLLREAIEADTTPPAHLQEVLTEVAAAIRAGRAAGEGRNVWAARQMNALLRDTVARVSGRDGLAALAREEGASHPETYEEWVKLLLQEGDLDAAIEAAREGSERITEPTPRAALADRLVQLAERAGDAALGLDACRRAWRARPSRRRLLRLCASGRPNAQELAARIESERVAARNGEVKPDDGMMAALELLACDREAAAARLEQVRGVTLYGSLSPQDIVLPFLLLAGSAAGPPPEGSVIAGMWAEIDKPDYEDLATRPLDPDDHDAEGDDTDVPAVAGARVPTLGELLLLTLVRREPEPEEQAAHLAVVRRAAERWLRGTVGGTHRSGYSRVSKVLVACAEAHTLAGRPAEGSALLTAAHAAYPRHTAFQGELRAAIAASPIIASAPWAVRRR